MSAGHVCILVLKDAKILFMRSLLAIWTHVHRLKIGVEILADVFFVLKLSMSQVLLESKNA